MALVLARVPDKTIYGVCFGIHFPLQCQHTHKRNTFSFFCLLVNNKFALTTLLSYFLYQLLAISTSRVENRVDPDQLSSDLHLHCFQNQIYPAISRHGLKYLISLSASLTYSKSKQNRPRSDCSCRSSLIRDFLVVFISKNISITRMS